MLLYWAKERSAHCAPIVPLAIWHNPKHKKALLVKCLLPSLLLLFGHRQDGKLLTRRRIEPLKQRALRSPPQA